MPEKQNADNQPLQSDHVKVTVTQHPHCKIELNVEVSPITVKASFQKAVKEIKKDISLPGFRKGKAPDAVVLKKYASYVDQRWKEITVNNSLNEALVLTKLHPISNKQVQHTLESCSDEEGAIIRFEFESEPEIPEIDIQSIDLKKIEKEEVEQEKVDEVISMMLSYHVEFEDIKDRPIEEGDYVDLDIQDLKTQKMIVTDRRFEMKEKKTGNWLRKLVIGLSTGDTAEGMSEADENLPKESLKNFKPTNCRLTVKGIFKGTPPEIDDEFAKKLGATSVAELRTNIYLRLTAEAEAKAQKAIKDQLEEALTKSIEFDVPETLVETEKQNRMQDRIYKLKQSGLSDEEITKQQPEIENEIEAAAKRALKLYFIFRKLAFEKKVQVTEDELRKSIMHHLSEMGLLQHKNPNLDERLISELRMLCYIEIINDKVKDLIIQQAKVT